MGGPICLVGQGYNIPRKRGSKPISQNYQPGGDGGGVVEDIFVLLLYSMEKVQRVRCKILEEQCFQCEHPEGTLWPANIQRAVKYPGIGIPISAIEKWRNVATGAFCIVTDGSADGLNRGKRMRAGGRFPLLISNKAQQDEQGGKGQTKCRKNAKRGASFPDSFLSLSSVEGIKIGRK